LRLWQQWRRAIWLGSSRSSLAPEGPRGRIRRRSRRFPSPVPPTSASAALANTSSERAGWRSSMNRWSRRTAAHSYRHRSASRISRVRPRASLRLRPPSYRAAISALRRLRLLTARANRPCAEPCDVMARPVRATARETYLPWRRCNRALPPYSQKESSCGDCKVRARSDGDVEWLSPRARGLLAEAVETVDPDRARTVFSDRRPGDAGSCRGLP
jgi:hypothetical protein